MKSYKDMADKVFSRIEEEKNIEITKQKRTVLMDIFGMVVGLGMLIGMGAWISGQVTVGQPVPDNPKNSEIQTEADSQAESQIEETPEKLYKVKDREVVFANYYKNIELDYEFLFAKNRILIEKYTNNGNDLYACVVSLERGDIEAESLERLPDETDSAYAVRTAMYEAEHLVDFFIERDIMVLEDYPYTAYNNYEWYALSDGTYARREKFVAGQCVVVGTYSQLTSLFDETNGIDGYTFHVTLAPRPDFLEQIEANISGAATDASMSEEEWIKTYQNDLPESLGSNYVALRVPVMIPDTSIKPEVKDEWGVVSVAYDEWEFRARVTDFRDAEDAELIYEDENYQYYLEYNKSDSIIVSYRNRTKENIKEALAAGRADINTLVEYDIGCFAVDKSFKEDDTPQLVYIIGTDVYSSELSNIYYEDGVYIYYFDYSVKHTVFAYYSDGTRESIDKALQNGRITIEDVDKYGIRYRTEPNIVSIIDLTKNGDIECVQKKECFYEYAGTRCYFNCIKSMYIELHYAGGMVESLKEAIEAGRVRSTLLPYLLTLYEIEYEYQSY